MRLCIQALQRARKPLIDRMHLRDFNDTQTVAGQAADFRTTDWSMIVSAQKRALTACRSSAREIVQHILVSFVRVHPQAGLHPPHDAQDLTQSFFAFLLGKKILNSVDQRKGKFRSFLLSSLKNFLANEWDRKRAIKRGGQYSFVSWDEEKAESLYQRSMPVELPPEQEFERNWATVLLQTVQTALRDEYAASGKIFLCRGH